MSLISDYKSINLVSKCIAADSTGSGLSSILSRLSIPLSDTCSMFNHGPGVGRTFVVFLPFFPFFPFFFFFVFFFVSADESVVFDVKDNFLL